MTAKVTLLHYNDVYNIESRKVEPVGGAARFKTAADQFAHLNPLTVFCGDVFSPSIMSTFTRGRHLPPVLNLVGTNIAVYGNHDFDQGLENTMFCKEGCTFPWLLANVIDLNTGNPLGEGIPRLVMEWEGRKIGFVGLVEESWIDTLGTVDPKFLEYHDFIEIGTKLAAELREEGCDAVIALTHMRTANDLRLANSEADFDLILAGHDHDYDVVKGDTGKIVLKSGTDFRYFSLVTLEWEEGNNKPTVGHEMVEITSEFEENEEMKQLCQEYVDNLEGLLAKEIGHLGSDLDGRFATVRAAESNLGNFVADIMVANTNADCAIVNGGNFRSDQIHNSGVFTLRDLNTILAFNPTCVVVEVKGHQLAQALENSVAKYPELEGRFLQVSGISFLFDPSKDQGERVDPSFIKIGGEFLKPDSVYKVASTAYVAISGKDGFECMLPNKVILTEDEGPAISVLVQNHFASVAQMKELGSEAPVHRQSLLLLSRREGVAKQFLKKIGKETSSLRNIHLEGGLTQAPVSIMELELECIDIAPMVEGRIKIVNEEDIHKLEKEKDLHKYVQERLGAHARFPSEKMAQIEESFRLFDANGDGTISRSELAEALEKQGAKPSEADLNRIWREVDKDESDSIDFEEFVALMADNFEVTDNELLDAFRTFDADGNGTLCEEEVLTVMRALGMWLSKAQVKKLMVEADSDNSGDISYEELVDYMKTQ